MTYTAACTITRLSDECRRSRTVIEREYCGFWRRAGAGVDERRYWPGLARSSAQLVRHALGIQYALQPIHGPMLALAKRQFEESTPKAAKAMKGKGETRPVHAEQASGHEADLLDQQSVALDAQGKADHGDISHEKRHPAVA